MAEVLSPLASSSSPSPHSPRSPGEKSESFTSSTSHVPRPQPRERIPSYAQNRMSHYSFRSSRSRPSSVVYPAYSSSLSYALVRDFAYPVYHPMHYGAEPESSGNSTPVSDWTPSRRQSDPMEQWNSAPSGHTGGWTAGPWGGDGVIWGEPGHAGGAGEGEAVESLPATSFAHHTEDSSQWGDQQQLDDFRVGRHRKSRSYASISEFERGRRRDSSRRGAGDPVHFSGQQNDPAGRESLRLSRGEAANARLYSDSNTRKDSHFAVTLPSRSFHNSQSAEPSSSTTPDSDHLMPLDAEPHPHPAANYRYGDESASPLRASLGPEDEELFAGPSLALYAFEPLNPNELRLLEGQEIMVSYRHGQGWLVASDPRSGEQGLVPEAYVRLLKDIPCYDPETGQWQEEGGMMGRGEVDGDEDDDIDDELDDEHGIAEASNGAHDEGVRLDEEEQPGTGAGGQSTSAIPTADELGSSGSRDGNPEIKSEAQAAATTTTSAT